MPNLPWPKRTLFQLSLTGIMLGQQVVNVHTFEASSITEALLLNDGLAQTESGKIADDWLTNCKTAYLATKPADYLLDRVACQVLERPGTFRHKLTPTERVNISPRVGTATGTCEDLQACAVIRWRTPNAGKSHRGRSYVGPIVREWVLDGRLAGLGITAITAYADAMKNRYTGAGSAADDWPMTIYSRPYNAGEYQYATRKTGSLTVVTPPDYAGDSTFVTDYALDTIIRVQRRRQIGVGA